MFSLNASQPLYLISFHAIYITCVIIQEKHYVTIQDQLFPYYKGVHTVPDHFRHLDQEEAADKLAELDEDEDDHVSWDEYIHKTYGYKPEELTEMEKDKNEEVQTFVRVIFLT